MILNNLFKLAVDTECLGNDIIGKWVSLGDNHEKLPIIEITIEQKEFIESVSYKWTFKKDDSNILVYMVNNIVFKIKPK